MKKNSSARRGFTLIELLVVIAIISILSMLTFALFKAAKNGNNKGKARGEIQALSTACEVYKEIYGDYPCGSSSSTPSNSSQWRKDFFDQLIGRKVISITAIAAGGSSISLVAYNNASLPGGTSRKLKSFVSTGTVPSNNDDLLSADPTKLDAYEFRDPWGNAYDYRYRTVSTNAISATGFFNSPYGDWTSPRFLIVSCGINYAEPATAETSPGFSDYWDSPTTTPKTGQISSNYFQDDDAGGTYFRADNIVNWTTN
jgi:prepilin-type N-terminal cleavage/methylation domain-containing protein